MKRSLAVGFLVLLAGCSAFGGLGSSRADEDALRAGVITEAEFEQRSAEHKKEIQEKVFGWIEMALGIGAAFGIPGAAVAVNVMRNRNWFTRGVRVPANAHIEVPLTPDGAVVAAPGKAQTDIRPVEVAGPTATVEAGNAVKS
jgi:hypothetical protein